MFLQAGQVTPKTTPTLTRKHIHFGENTQIGVRDVQTAAEFPRRSRSRSKSNERYLDDADRCRVPDDKDVSSIVLDAALHRDTQLLVSEAECRALPLADQQTTSHDSSLISAMGNDEEVTPVVLSGKMTISFLGGPDGMSVDVPEVRTMISFHLLKITSLHG
jgi:hypothetical protein